MFFSEELWHNTFLGYKCLTSRVLGLSREHWQCEGIFIWNMIPVLLYNRIPETSGLEKCLFPLELVFRSKYSLNRCSHNSPVLQPFLLSPATPTFCFMSSQLLRPWRASYLTFINLLAQDIFSHMGQLYPPHFYKSSISFFF